MFSGTKTSALYWITAFSSLAVAWPQPAINAHIRTDPAQLAASEYDYIILGGGTSGLTVGDRLSEDGKRTERLPP